MRNDFKISNPTLTSSVGSAASETLNVSPIPSDNNKPSPIADFTAPLRAHHQLRLYLNVKVV